MYSYHCQCFFHEMLPCTWKMEKCCNCKSWSQNYPECYKDIKAVHIIYVVLVSMSHNFQLMFRSVVINFQVTGQFWDQYTEWPQNGIEHYRVQSTPYRLCYWPQVWNYCPFSSIISCFWGAGHLVTCILSSKIREYMCWYTHDRQVGNS